MIGLGVAAASPKPINKPSILHHDIRTSDQKLIATPQPIENENSLNINPTQPAHTEQKQEENLNKIASLKIAQWNAAILSEDKLKELEIFAKERQLDCLLINEYNHHNHSGNIKKINGYDNPLITQPPETRGIATYYKSCVNWTHPDTINNEMKEFWPNCLSHATIVQSGEISILIWNVYVHPRTRKSARLIFWNHVAAISAEYSHVIIAGDLNEKTSFTDPSSNNNHPSFDCLERRNNMICLNNGSPTRVQWKRSSLPSFSCLDYTFTSANIASLTKSWQVLHELSSDHFPIIMELDIRVQRFKAPEDQKFVNWNKCRKYVKTLWSRTDVHERAARLISIFTSAIQDCCSSYSKSNKTPCPWWDDELEELRTLKIEARKQEDYPHYLLLKTTMRRVFRQKKTCHFNTMLRDIATSNNPWRVLRAIAPSTRFKRPVSPALTNPKRKNHIDRLALQYENLLNSAPSEVVFSQVSLSKKDKITKREVISAIKSANKKSSKGSDNIGYFEIDKLCEDPQILAALTCSMNIWISSGFPKNCKQARIYPIPKGVSESDGFRPISLLPCTAKLCERILASRITRIVEQKLPSNQCGCRSQLETVHCVARLLHASAMACETNQRFGVLFIDFSKAYDRVPWQVLLRKMSMLEIPEYLIQAVYFWLQDRTFYVSIGEINSTTRNITNGLPQGSALSVVLWLIYVHDFPSILEESALFMDDAAVWSTANKKTTLKENLTNIFKLIHDWCQQSGIVINDKKSCILLNRSDRNFTISCEGMTIKSTTTSKYLGFNLYSIPVRGFPIQIDLNKVAQDIHRRCRVLKPLVQRTDGTTSLTFGRALIIAKIKYFLPVLSAEHKSTLAPLKNAYHKCLRILTGALYGTPNTVLFSQTGLPPLEMLIEESSRQLYFRIMKNPNALIAKEFEQWSTSTYKGSPYIGMYRVEKSLPETLRELPLAGVTRIPSKALESLAACNFNILKTKIAATQKLKEQKLIPKNADMYIYTDGSLKYDENSGIRLAGAAFNVWCPKNQEIINGAYKVVPPTSSYHSEMLALHTALDDSVRKLDNWINGKAICILSDSKSLITHLKSVSETLNPLVLGEIREIVEWIHDLRLRSCKITLTWIPGHAGIPGNIRADNLANIACTASDELISQLQYSTVKNWSKRELQSSFAEHLRKETSNSKSNCNAASRNRFQNIMANPRPGSCSNRRAEISLFRVLSGHCNIGAHWFRRGRKDSNYMCRKCGYHLETVEHLLFSCSKLPFRNDVLRQKLCREREKCANFRQFLDLLNKHTEKLMSDRIIELQTYGVVL